MVPLEQNLFVLQAQAQAQLVANGFQQPPSYAPGPDPGLGGGQPEGALFEGNNGRMSRASNGSLGSLQGSAR